MVAESLERPPSKGYRQMLKSENSMVCCVSRRGYGSAVLDRGEGIVPSVRATTTFPHSPCCRSASYTVQTQHTGQLGMACSKKLESTAQQRNNMQGVGRQMRLVSTSLAAVCMYNPTPLYNPAKFKTRAGYCFHKPGKIVLRYWML